jgi:hypothetical protein
MGTQGVHLTGVVLWLVRWAGRAGTRDFSFSMASLVVVGPVYNIFYSGDTFSKIYHYPARQSCRVTCLLMSVTKPDSTLKEKR